VGSREYPAAGTRHAVGSVLMGAGPRARPSRRRVRSFGGAVINLGYPWWLLAVVLVAFVLLLYRALRARFSRWPLAGLAAVLSPVCTLAAVAAALTLSAMLSPLYKAPAEPSGGSDPPARARPATTQETTNPRTAAPSATPTASLSASSSSSSTPSSSASPSP
jgi:hypothetical protein